MINLCKPSISLFSMIFFFVFLINISVGLFSQTAGNNKAKTQKDAENLCLRARIYVDSAQYDSAIILYTKASEIYKKKNKVERLIGCQNEIVKQSKYIRFNDELLNLTKENLTFAISQLGNNHKLTAESYSLVGNVFADINKTDSALYYFK